MRTFYFFAILFFTIKLMPRYSGDYSLNPAKAEMMYFPVFYGRESMKRVTVNSLHLS